VQPFLQGSLAWQRDRRATDHATRSVTIDRIYLPSVLWHCWLGGRKGIRPVKMGDGGHCLVRMEWRPARWSVCLPLIVFPCTIKSRSSLLAPDHPGGPGKRAVKRLCVCVYVRSTAMWRNNNDLICALLLPLPLHPFNSLFSRTTWVSQHQKGKPFWILLEQEMMGWQWHQLDHMQIIYTLLQTDNCASTSPLKFLQTGCLSCHRTNSVKALKA